MSKLQNRTPQFTEESKSEGSSNLPTPPSWWRGDEEASRSSLVAIQSLQQSSRSGR